MGVLQPKGGFGLPWDSMKNIGGGAKLGGKNAGLSLGARIKPLLLSLSVFCLSYSLGHLLSDGIPFIFAELLVLDERVIPWSYSLVVVCVYGGPWLLLRKVLSYQWQTKPPIQDDVFSHNGNSCDRGKPSAKSVYKVMKYLFISLSLGVGVGLLALVPGLLLAYVDGKTPLPVQFWSGISSAIDAGDIGNWVVACMVAPIFEELWYRDLGLSSLMNLGLSFKRANVLQSLLFACAHQSMPEKFLGFAAGLLLGMVRLKTGQISFCIVAHGVVNSDLANIGAALMCQAFLKAGAFTDTQASSEALVAPGTLAFAGLLLLIGLLLISPLWRKRL